MDALSLQRIQLLHPKLRIEATQILKEIEAVLTGNAHCRFTFTLRTFSEQQTIYNQGRTTGGIVVTNAKPGQSLHNYGLAVDIALIVDTDNNGSFETSSWNTIKDYDKDGKADWMECVAIFKKYGWIWGADWNNNGVTKAQGDTSEKLVDAPHFQKTFGLTWQQCLKLYEAKSVDSKGYILI